MSLALVKIIRQNTAGIRRQLVATFSGPASYTTGGDVNTVANLSGGRIKEADFVRVNSLSNSGTYAAHTIYSSDGGVQSVKIKVFVVATGVEVANAFNLSAEKFRITVQGN